MNNPALDRFSALLAPQVDPRFKINFSLEDDIVEIRITDRLPGLNPGFTIGEFCKHHRNEMLAAILQTGEEIQRYRLSCCELVFQAHNARNLIKALADHRGIFIDQI